MVRQLSYEAITISVAAINKRELLRQKMISDRWKSLLPYPFQVGD